LRELTGYRITWTGAAVSYRVEVSADGSAWLPVAAAGSRQDFTGLGRHVRITASDGQASLAIRKLEVFSTR